TDAYLKAWAAAESVDANASICHKESGDEAIAGCTAAIQSGKLRGEGLAIVFYGRGFEYQKQENLDRAIADYSEAIRLDREKAGAFFNRGVIYAQREDYVHAIADYSEAIRINPHDPIALMKRGEAERLIGNGAEADADFAQACKLDSSYCERITR